MSTDIRTALTQSTGRQAEIAVLLVTGAGSVANPVISSIAQAAGADTADGQGLTPGAYISLTFSSVVVGVLVWIAVRCVRPC